MFMLKDDLIFSKNKVPLKEMTKEKIDRERKRAKRYALSFTILYIFLFPLFFNMGLVSFMIFDTPRMTIFLGLPVVFLTLLISLTMLISIYLMRSSYLRGEYKKIYFYCVLPLFTFVGVFWINDILITLFL
ncbi:MAG: hypothetical protein Q8K60_04685 [Parachlamydiaceae bacterium]|nr:hypothetical protein [Parachlamydiaceae bacterium]